MSNFKDAPPQKRYSAARKQTTTKKTQNSLCVFCFHVRRGLRVCHVWLQRCSNDDIPNPEKKKKQTTAAQRLLCFVCFRRETEDFMSCLASKMLQKQYSEPRKRTKQTPTQSCLVCVWFTFLFISVVD